MNEQTIAAFAAAMREAIAAGGSARDAGDALLKAFPGATSHDVREAYFVAWPHERPAPPLPRFKSAPRSPIGVYLHARPFLSEGPTRPLPVLKATEREYIVRDPRDRRRRVALERATMQWHGGIGLHLGGDAFLEVYERPVRPWEAA